MHYGKGFTLIELLIVVAIIAILAAIAVPNFLEAQVRAKISRNRADMRTVATALETYRIDQNKYPPAWEYGATGTWEDPGFPTPPFHSRVPSRLTTPVAYLTSIPSDPFRKPNELTGTLAPFSTRHIYFNMNYSLGAAPTSQNFIHAQKMGGEWFFYSVGPDKTEWNAPTVLGQRVYRDYDPTNGTNSYGNIFRTQKDPEKLGVDPFYWTTP
jgi:type II secretion system protein G